MNTIHNTFWAQSALTADGWQNALTVGIDEAGIIRQLEANTPPQETQLGILLPSPSNLHSHAFQRAMAGLSEYRGSTKEDSFWTWRELMYRFLHVLTPEDVESIATFVQMEMLEAGYSSVCEFHYLHHQPGGRAYADRAELSASIAAAASQTGIGLTHLPVFYQYASCDQTPAGSEQQRFVNTLDQFSKMLSDIHGTLAPLPRDTVLGIAPHSLRAVSPDDLRQLVNLLPDTPLHIHIAEQQAEVEEVSAAYGARPVQWLLDNHDVDDRWCLIHATHLLPEETKAFARSNATAGLCPITEANLGDGIFNARQFLEHGGHLGIGSDSNIRISLSEELRLLEYSQRLRDQQRSVLSTASQSTGRVLLEQACRGGAKAASRNAGGLEVGKLADMMALDGDSIHLADKQGDTILDSFIFAGDDRMISDVWSAGRHLVTYGKHQDHEIITRHYRDTLHSLQSRL